ncbi:hypothetical protein N9N28_04825 [Rubripirellula amarantea]|uniref:Anthranilate phosphoribosyltransferase n=1 Tax=Rubripirellula amarantea TaxID=2527999 RepID=A0A5C5WI65_9BACT|nr:hypothetical protein [Rubripirellula amarantea]MDA8743939.1 hypothetical protein [Rubripirellula amarantea]TWT50257.1 anthranilate phosphoribosyltransferase [Rubripirellula amarantea]
MNSPNLFAIATQQARKGNDLSVAQTSELIDTMLRGEASDDDIAALLLALKDKGESVSELVGASQAMRRHIAPSHGGWHARHRGTRVRPFRSRN